MKRQQNSSVLPWALLTIPVLWMGAVLAYGYEDGMNVIELLGRFAVLVERPFSIRWTPHTLEEEDPDHIAVREYKIFKQAAGDLCSKRLVNSLIFR